MKKWLKIGLIAVVALLLPLAMTWTRNISITIGEFEYLEIQILSSSCVFFIYTLICLWKFKAIKPRLTTLIIALGGSAILLPIIVFSYKEVHPTTVVEYLMQTISIFAAYQVFTRKHLISKIAIGILTLVATLWMTCYGLNLYTHYYCYGSCTGRISEQIEHPVEFQNPEGETIGVASYKGTYLVLDCWNTWCGVCYRKFPELQAIYEKYKDNPAITIAALHCRLEDEDETYRTGYQIIQERGYTFPVFSISRSLPSLKELKVRYYPTVLVFSPSGELVFRGDIENLEKFFQKVL